MQGNVLAKGVSTFSPKVDFKRLWVNKTWKQLLLRFGVLCSHIVTYAYTRQDLSQSRFHVLFAHSLYSKALGEREVETASAMMWRIMLACSNLYKREARS